MTVLELPSTTRSTGSWTQVCASEHSVTSRAVHDVLGSAPRDVRVFDESRPSGARTLVPGRRVSSGLAAGDHVSACRVGGRVDEQVVDDVPTWVLLTCGIVVGLALLLALALTGGPAYA